MRVIATAGQKGGIGKTTTTFNIAAALAERGRSVLMADMDPQGALSGACMDGLSAPRYTVYHVLLDKVDIDQVVRYVGPNRHLIPADIDLAAIETQLAGELGRELVLSDQLRPWAEEQGYDYVLIDCPPSLGLLTVNALCAADEVLVPVATQFLALKALSHLAALVEKIQRRTNPRLHVVGILPTLYDQRNSHDRDAYCELKEKYPALLIDYPVHRRTQLADSMQQRQSILEYAPNSESARTFRSIAEVLDAKQA